jgi:phenylpropionate dioxygenase-like ring-hydroxylating dioxygenase large terminal subunit
MMSREQNELMTRIGPGQPAGELLRRYWQPVALLDEFAGMDRPVKPVRLLGEELVLFRDEDGRFGLLDRHCAHRGADLAYGRLEDGGLRCLFHGWLFDSSGRCLDTPAEPAGSRLCERVRQRAFPLVAKAGILWAYLAEGTAPAFPRFDCFTAPDTHVFAFKGWWECNWLQALEVGIDPAHASFLHVYFEDEDPREAYGRQFRSASSDTDVPMTQVLREYNRPEIRVERTPWGQRLVTLRKIDAASTHVRVTNTLFPQAFLIPMSDEITISQWHVPIDDENTYWYTVFTSFGKPIEKDRFREIRLKTYPAPDYKPVFNRRNRYGYDAAEQRSRTYTGMGMDINIHDQFACESQGAIQDRTREHLAGSDRGIVSYRRMLLEAIETVRAGGRPLMWLDEAAAVSLSGPDTVDGVGPSEGWEAYWHALAERRRRNAPWLGGEQSAA